MFIQLNPVLMRDNVMPVYSYVVPLCLKDAT